MASPDQLYSLTPQIACAQAQAQYVEISWKVEHALGYEAPSMTEVSVFNTIIQSRTKPPSGGYVIVARTFLLTGKRPGRLVLVRLSHS